MKRLLIIMAVAFMPAGCAVVWHGPRHHGRIHSPSSRQQVPQAHDRTGPGDGASTRRTQETQSERGIEPVSGGIPMGERGIRRFPYQALQVASHSIGAQPCGVPIGVEPVAAGIVAEALSGPLPQDQDAQFVRGNLSFDRGRFER